MKFDFLSQQIIERIEIRRKTLEALLQDEVRIDTKIWSSEPYGITAHGQSSNNLPLYMKLLDLNRERRSQDTECWRDLVHVFRDLLQIWEDLEQSKVRDSMLYGIPDNYGGVDDTNKKN